MDNEIITKDDASIRTFRQMAERVYEKLERFCKHSRPTLGGESFLSGEELCLRLKISSRTLQEYRNNGTLPFYKIGGKILYKESDIQRVLEQNYNPIKTTRR